MRLPSLAIATAALALVVTSLMALPADPAAAQRTPGRQSTCTGVISGTVTANTVRLCDEAEVFVQVEPECPACPGGLNVIFVQLAMAPEYGWQNSESVRILNELQRWADRYKPQNVSLGVIHYDTQSARTVQRLTNDFASVRNRLNGPTNGYVPVGAAESAANEAVKLLRQARREANNAANPCELVVMFAHIKNHDGNADMLRRAGQIIKRENVVFLVGCPINPGAWYCNGPEPDMPRSRRFYSPYPESGKLASVARQEMGNVPGDVTMRELHLTQLVPDGLAAHSFSSEPAEVVTETSAVRYTWKWMNADASQVQSVTYKVSPVTEGDHTIGSNMRVVDNLRLVRDLPLDVPVTVSVIGPCPVDTPTPTATATATAMPTPTATVPPSATPTPSVYTIYLPINMREDCQLRQRHADVVLVLDASTSMRRPTVQLTRSKLEAMQSAALTFVDTMRLTPDDRGDFDQVAVVAFNKEAWILQRLTNDRAALAQAINGLPERVAEYTRLDLGLLVGAEALADERHRPDNAKILVFLTDGLPNQVPYAIDGTMETTVLAAAAVVKAMDASIYTIGLGRPDAEDVADQINGLLLQAIATRPDMYYETPDGDDLTGIYSEIAVTIGCPRGGGS